MPLQIILIAPVVVGVALYLITTYIPMDSSTKMNLNVIVAGAVCVWLLQAIGVMGNLSSYQLAR